MANPRATAYFTPHGADASHRQALLDAVGRARHTVEFMSYAFTAAPVGDALIAAAARGVTVRGVCDATQALNPKAQAPRLRAAGLDVRLWGTTYDLAHDKVLLVDGGYPRSAYVLLGSHNWTGGSDTTNREASVSLSGSWVTRSFAPGFLAQLSAAYAAGK